MQAPTYSNSLDCRPWHLVWHLFPSLLVLVLTVILAWSGSGVRTKQIRSEWFCPLASPTCLWINSGASCKPFWKTLLTKQSLSKWWAACKVILAKCVCGGCYVEFVGGEGACLCHFSFKGRLGPLEPPQLQEPINRGMKLLISESRYVRGNGKGLHPRRMEANLL